LHNSTLNLFTPSKQKLHNDYINITDLSDPRLEEFVGEEYANEVREETELIEGVYDKFSQEEYAAGQMAPVFFGSAVNNFGVQEMLDTFVEIAPLPLGRPSDAGQVDPMGGKFSGFIFKIHANLDPKHRDRIAFLRVCSGKFERNKFFHHVRLDKNMKFANPYSILAASKEVIEEAYSGDVVGLYDTGNFKIGDTMTEGSKFTFKGIPSFSPEIFKELVNTDPMKTKQLEKGIQQLTDEGVAQLFTYTLGNKKLVGTVGELQFEVIKHRLEHEYGASCEFHPVSYFKACWITSDDNAKLQEFIRIKASYLVFDKDMNPVFLAVSAWILQTEKDNYPEITFHENSEFKVGEA
jgi:peptide chain release factor 3